MKYSYGGYIAEKDKVYTISGNGKHGLLKCIDIFDEFWDEWGKANIVFIDFPYDDRMVKHFYEQIDVSTDRTFVDLKNRAFKIIDRISPERVFVEIGKRNVQPVIDSLNAIGYKTRVHEAVYDKKYTCFIIEGNKSGAFINYSIQDMDELQSMDEICKHEYGCICDFFNGLGSVSFAAYRNGMNFVCSELNPNRLGKTLHKFEKMGAVIS